MVKLKQQFGGFGCLRLDSPNAQAFNVNFVNERGIDAGGPYREILDSVATELMTTVLPVLRPTPN